MQLRLLDRENLLKKEDARVEQRMLSLNPQTRLYGLELSHKDAAALAATRRNALKESGRLEFGPSVLEKIILKFSRSEYLYSYNYVPVLENLVETFFLLKSELYDRISDDRLIDFLFESFERNRGSMKMFEGREVDALRRRLSCLEVEEPEPEEPEEEGEDEGQ